MAESRPLTISERTALERDIAALRRQLPTPASLTVAAFPSLMAGLSAAVALTLLARLFGHAMPPFVAIPVAVAAGLLVFLKIRTGYTRAVAAQKRHIDALMADLSHGVVLEDSFNLSKVKRYKDPEHGVKLYALHLTDGRIRALVDAAGTDLAEARSTKALGPRIAANVTMTTYPASGECRYSFAGAPLRLPKFRELTAAPETWPAEDSWLDISWDELDQRLSG